MKVTYEDHFGSDLKVVNMARVSFRKRKEILDDKDARLISYLAAHNHWAPFGHCGVTLHITAPVAIRSQLFKHKIGFVESEVSRRYVNEEPEFYIPGRWREKPVDKKQGSGRDYLDYRNNSTTEAAIEFYKSMKILYNELITGGMCPEQVRFFMPQGMMTEWYWTGSLVAYARMYGLRYAPDAQKETQEIAQQIGEIISSLFPISWAALTKDYKNA